MFTPEAVGFVLAAATAICVVLGPLTIIHFRREGITNRFQEAQIAIGLVFMVAGAVGYRWFGIGFTALTFGIGQWVYGRVVWPAIPRLIEHRFEQKLKR